MSTQVISAQPRAWWKSAVVYQIYPLSFLDSSGSGTGDLPGITSKLDYLHDDLGVDVIWLSPIYEGPGRDMGYDISDYTKIDTKYGTLEDWDVLLKEVHKRGMKLMMDLVVNHTSDEHEWFKQSRSSSDESNDKKDWYIWRPAKYDTDGTRRPPNNWRAAFEGSAWTYDTTRDAYYLHLYLSSQPDLNWANPEVREAVWGVMRFWLDRGCDGFRMDVINLISKHPDLPDAPVSEPGQEWQPAAMYYANGPHVHEYLREMNAKVLSKYPELITVGETPYTSHSPELLAPYVLPDRHELGMIFQFDLMSVDTSPSSPSDWLSHAFAPLPKFKEIVSGWQRFKWEEGFWNATYLENHDQARSVSRFGDTSTDEKQKRSAKLIAAMQGTLGGTLYVYQGEELGLKNFSREWGIEEYKDVASQNWYERNYEERKKGKKEGEEVDMGDVMDGLHMKARDHARVPMQWDDSPNAGFTSSTPWMRVNDDYKIWNAANQVGNPESVLAFWKKTLQVRRAYADILVYGSFTDLSSTQDHKQLFAYTRTADDGRRALVLLNFSDKELGEVPEAPNVEGWELVLGNYDSESAIKKGEEAKNLRAWEARVWVSPAA